ncbi:hypothetical protein KEM48_012991 [Puccinia striiformis f. sp. tritici PST-130]|nr:hypothetical protein KEM48_012991 [Puccinia striiformis f. sp. tritici PST-130]
MSDDRFTYIHLRSETSLWSYADDQVDWLLEDLEDRRGRSIRMGYDTPYQNEDDEGILPSHSHPSYPFGNPYDPSQPPVQAPQLARVVNQPLAVGSALLLPSSSGGEPGGQQAYWTELATDRLLRYSGHTDPLLDDPHPDEIPLDQADHHHHHLPADTAQHPDHTPARLSNNHLRTPANDLYRPTARPTHTPATDHTDLTFGSEDDGGEQDETGPMIE